MKHTIASDGRFLDSSTSNLGVDVEASLCRPVEKGTAICGIVCPSPTRRCCSGLPKLFNTTSSLGRGVSWACGYFSTSRTIFSAFRTFSVFPEIIIFGGLNQN